MANGFLQRFQGKVKCAAIWLGTGGIVDAASGIGGQPVTVQKISLPVTATANTDFTVSAPAGKTLLRATVYTSIAYTAVTDAKVSIGSSAGAQTYVAQATIAVIGVYPLTLVGAAAGAEGTLPAPPQLFVRVTQTGTPSAVGAATLVLEYA